MSVINQMLNDLDKRRQSESAQQDETFLTLAGHGRKIWLTALAGALLLGGLVAFLALRYLAPAQTGSQGTAEHSVPVVKQQVRQQVKQQVKQQAPSAQITATIQGKADKPSGPTVDPRPQNKPQNESQNKRRQPTLSLQLRQSEAAVPAVIAVQNDQRSSRSEAPVSPRTVAQNNPQQQPGAGVTTTAPVEVAPVVMNEVHPVDANKAGEGGTRQAATVVAAQQSEPQSMPQAPSPQTSRPTAGQTPKAVPKMQVKPVRLTFEQRSEKRYLAAQKLARRGLIKPAIDQYRQILQANPSHGLSRRALVALHFGRENIAAAMAVLDQGVAIEPGNISWSLLAAKIHYKQKNYVAALGYLQLPVLAAEQLEYVALKAASLQQLKQFSAASDEFERLAVANPGNGRWWLGLGTSFEAQGQHTAAIAAYRKSLALMNISQTSRQFVMSRLDLLASKKQ